MIVTPKESFVGGLIVIDGKISEILKEEELVTVQPAIEKDMEVYDAKGSYIIPGLVDLHGDALEKIIQPRKKVLFPVDFALRVIQPQLLSSGITSMYHGVSFTGEAGIRSNENGYEIAKEINRLSSSPNTLLRHHLHLRYELVNHLGLDTITELIKKGWVSLLSIMDHTPQYGKYRTLDEYKYYVEKTHQISGEDLDQYIEKQRAKRDAVDPEAELKLIRTAKQYRIPVASHDDDTSDKVRTNVEKGIQICEFPLNEEAASSLREVDIDGVVGGPNVLKGFSHEKNLSAREALTNGWTNIICSDYYPFSLLSAIFILADEGIPLPQAVAFASLNPAKAVGIDHTLGSLERGKAADLLIVNRDVQVNPPIVIRAMVDGKWNYSISNNFEKKEENLHYIHSDLTVKSYGSSKQ